MSFESQVESPDVRHAEIFARPMRGPLRLVHLLYLVFFCALAFWLVALIKVPLVLAILVFLAALVVGLVILVSRRRSTLQEGLLWTLAVAAERQMPLAPALEAYAEHCYGEYRCKARALAFYLNRGLPLPQALHNEPGTLARDTELLVRMGWETGTLTSAFREAGFVRTKLRPVWASIAYRIAYLLFVMVVMEGISGYLFVYILPRMQAICRDFRVGFPTVTLRAISLSEELLPYGFWVMLLEIMLILYVLFTTVAWWRIRVPFLSRRHTALVLRSLSWVMEGGMPLPRGVNCLAGWYPTEWVRAKLDRVALDLAHGADWTESLHRHRLIRSSDAAVLRAAARVGNLPWAMRELAENCERRLAYRLEAIVQIVFPSVLLALGCWIGFLAVCYFAPLIRIIELCASWS